MAKNEKGRAEHWQDEPEEKDFLAAANYLCLLFTDADAASIVEGLRSAPPSVTRRATCYERAGSSCCRKLIGW